MFEYIIDNVEIYFNNIENKIVIYSKYDLVSFFLPSFFYLKEEKNKYKFLFTNKFFYFSFFRNLIYFWRRAISIFYFKLKLKGLGFRMFHITPKLFEFFFRKNLRYFFYVPKNIFIKRKNREIIVLSNNKHHLNDLFNNLIFLKKMDFYDKTKSFIVKNKILYLKKRK